MGWLKPLSAGLTAPAKLPEHGDVLGYNLGNDSLLSEEISGDTLGSLGMAANTCWHVLGAIPRTRCN